MARIARAAALALAALLAGCAGTEDIVSSAEVVRFLPREVADRVSIAEFSAQRAGEAPHAPWEPYILLPSKPRTAYRLVKTDIGVALEATAESSASGKVRKIRIEPQRHPVLEWRWRVDSLIPGADKRYAGSEDSPVRLIVSFHGDPRRLDFSARTQLRMAKALSGRALPYATLMYVWSNDLPVGTVIENPHTDRIRMIVVASGAEGLGRWQSYRRNVVEDYRAAFGEEPWDVVAVGLMTDADNTRQSARALYGDIAFLRAP